MSQGALGEIVGAVVVARDGRVVVYMGDDERGEFLYKYVSNGIYVPGGDTPGCSMKAHSTTKSSPTRLLASGWR